jgi:hypothetical protein
MVVFFFRESDIQYVTPEEPTVSPFHTPGIFYRPANLKMMTAVMGNTEARVVYKNFQLENLNSNTMDYSHYHYMKYLQYNNFIPAGDKKYFAHMQMNTVPNNPSLTTGKGLFNLFPLDLSRGGMEGSPWDLTAPAKTLGVVSTSPLKLEIEFSPVPNLQWFLMYTFVYLNKAQFSGSSHKQDVQIDYVM